MNRTDTSRPPQRKALHFVICVKVLHNVTPIDLLAQSAVLYGWLLCLLCLTASFAIADGVEIVASDNHFQTYEARPQPAQPQQQVDPLTAYPVSQYIVHGVIVTTDNAVAVVYSPRKTWHRLQVNAQLGQEQAVIRQITTKGIQIDMQNTLLWLPVLQ